MTEDIEDQEDQVQFDDMDDEEKVEHLQEKVTDLEGQIEGHETENGELTEELKVVKQQLLDLQEVADQRQARLLELTDTVDAQANREAARHATHAPKMPEDEFKLALIRDVPTIRAIILKIKGTESPLLPTIDELLAKLAE